MENDQPLLYFSPVCFSPLAPAHVIGVAEKVLRVVPVSNPILNIDKRDPGDISGDLIES